MNSVINFNDLKQKSFHPGMGQAIAQRTILRKKENNEWETWDNVSNRVSHGNSLLAPEQDQKEEFDKMYYHMKKANLLMSGRHLQHGDSTQPDRNMEVFTNCSTASASFLLFYLLMNGSGVGRCYDDEMMLVDWDNAPNIRCVIDHEHPDFDWSAHESVRDAKHKYDDSKQDILWFKVPDSREGWAKALEIWENAAFEKIHKDKLFILDFSDVRSKGTPIKGMQSRPASGPVPLMNAFYKSSTLKGAGLDKWRQAMYIDHYFAECVLVGGARRAARMSTKSWKDRNVLDFITVKRPIEFNGKTMEEIEQIKKSYEDAGMPPPMGFLWSSNNSISVDEEFWNLLNLEPGDDGYNSDLAKHARFVFKKATEASYGDGTGEPGFINVDKLVQKDDGWKDLNRGDYVGSEKYEINEDTQIFMSRLAKRAKKLKYHTITNPCIDGNALVQTHLGEIPMSELVDRHLTGEPMWVQTSEGMRSVTHAGLTRENADVIELEFEENGEEYKLVCTPDHKIKTRNRGWVEAQNINEDDDVIIEES